jgi:hypothetical protein
VRAADPGLGDAGSGDRHGPGRHTAVNDQVNSLNLPAGGSFTTKGAVGKQDLKAFCQAKSTAIADITAKASTAASLVSFVNAHDLARYKGYQFSWGVAAHHFFVAEIVHELVD